MNIGIFGGAFNPVHNGHIHLLECLSKITQDLTPLDKIILIPTANPPHKTSDGLISGQHRVNMLRLAVAENGLEDKTEISTIEFESNEKSYTYHTLKKLKKIYPDDELYLLMGSDQLFYFKNWYKYKKILKLAQVSAITRNEKEREAVSEFLIENKDNFSGRVSAMVAKPIVISSTEIRQRLKSGENINGMVPKSVENYIKEQGLYV